ncbi:MAG: helix-turn-helix transcriptional regulator [Planctomycetes bacterium]|nr:helix-turn-helix transcriptional regulator [Planctomycetota bacterium]
MRPRLEHLSTPADASFRCFVRSDRAFAFEWHYHHDYELTLITRGVGKRFVGDHTASFAAPDLVLIGPDLPHTWLVPAQAGAMQRAIVLQFAPAFFERFAGMPEFAAVRELFARARRGLAFTGTTRTRAGKALQAITRARPAQRLPLALAVLIDLAASDEDNVHELAGPAVDPVSDPAGERRIDQVFRFLSEHARDRISQATVARQAGMTPGAFSRFFKRTTGKTFVAYIQELRIAHACERLIASDDAITDICFASGFANLSNFNRCFRRLKGVSPRAFRDQFRHTGS